MNMLAKKKFNVRPNNIACILLLTVFIAGIFTPSIYRALGVPALTPHFADLYTITSAGIALDRGDDPLIDNVGDPWLRPMNYPRPWLVLPLLGVTQRYTFALGAIVFIAFFITICWLFHVESPPHGWIVSICLLSPPILLGVERANTDLIIFIVLVVSIYQAKRHKFASVMLWLVACVLKIYPIILFPLYYRLIKELKFAELIVVVAMVVAYAYVVSDLKLIMAATPAKWEQSFGADVIYYKLRYYLGEASISELYRYGIKTLLVLALILSFQAGSRTKGNAIAFANRDYSMFQFGFVILVGVSVVTTSFDYRLVYVLLIAPAIACLISYRNVIGYVSGAVLVLFVWFEMWKRYLFRIVEVGAAELFEEVLFTLLLLCLAYILGAMRTANRFFREIYG